MALEGLKSNLKLESKVEITANKMKQMIIRPEEEVKKTGDEYNHAIPPSYFEVFERDEQFKPIITGGQFGKPSLLRKFSDCALDEVVLDNVRRSKYSKPTPIQSAAIPAILAGEDLMALAQTGLGKTAAFLLPLISMIKEKDLSINKPIPCAMIISATRELAKQIFGQAKFFAQETGVKVVEVHGGTNIRIDVENIDDGCHIIIGTMGRLTSLIHDGAIKLEYLKYLVIDEADRMLYSDNRKRTTWLLSHKSLPEVENRQTLLFSATFADEDQKLAGSFMKNKPNYMMIHTKTIGIANPNVQQYILDLTVEAKALKENTMDFVVNEGWTDKDKLLCIKINLEECRLRHDGTFNKKILVFLERKEESVIVARKLLDNDIEARAINADMTQRQRETALQEFTDGTVCVLVATDLAARGLHIPNIDHVINYELPSGNRRRAMEQYVNRIGRTGRAGKDGKATSFYDKSKDKDLARGLVDCMTNVQQEIPDWLQREARVLRPEFFDWS